MTDQRPPSINGSLFKDESPNRIDYSGTANISREDAMALCDYLLSNRAEADQYGLKLYVSGWSKTSQRTGKKYISLQIEPPKAAYNGTPPAQATRPQAPAPGPVGAPPQPVWNPQTQTWVMPAPPAPAPAPAAPPAPPQPVWDPQSQTWVMPPAVGAGGAPGQPYAPPAVPPAAPAPMPAAQAGAVWHSGGWTPSEEEVPF
jgi:hypothetical protein